MTSAIPSPPTDGSRRRFLHRLGAGALIAGFAGILYQSLRALVPNVLYEPSQRFKLGMPNSLPEGVTFVEDRRLYVFRDGHSFFAISAACTHLGCTVKYTKLNRPKRGELSSGAATISHEFHCPCHGSRFRADGTNYAGPAPRPLRWFKLEVSPDDGQLVANLGQEVDQGYRLTV
jgi:nitrite reductase/ring-hydroxylating ferredoxin subunit